MTALFTKRLRVVAACSAVVMAMAVPVVASVMSPLLAWRDPIYIVAGFAGVVALALLLVQPLMVSTVTAGIAAKSRRRAHQWTGIALVALVIIHVAGLWITSPPDVIDALLFASPTPFSVWGVISMWAFFATACLAFFRHRLRLRSNTWRISHKSLAVVIVAGSVIHALLIEGTMETVSKVFLCALVTASTLYALSNNRSR